MLLFSQYINNNFNTNYAIFLQNNPIILYKYALYYQIVIKNFNNNVNISAKHYWHVIAGNGDNYEK